MVRSPLRGNRAGQIIYAIFGVWYIYWITQFPSWTTRAEIIAFFAGAGGMMVMFYRWRRHGDRLAKVLCLTAFGTWMLACVIWGTGGTDAGKPGSPGFDAAAVALLAGFAGAIVVLIRLYAHRDRRSTAQSK
ncbi:MAG TPA: hypothetical protein VF070_16355 [Streptosporangiaceae bacterium]